MIEIGTRLKGGRWHLDALLGVGGTSSVYSATHRNGTRAAIKVLGEEFTDDPDMRARLKREGYAANKVGHPGAVRVLDDDTTEDGRAYLVMELLEGESVEAWRERLGGKLPLAETLKIADDLLDVLVAAHGQGIIHRDIKPENLFVTKAGELKVLDFGVAKIKETLQADRTSVGTVLGTPGFMPPERARGENDGVDARTDIWSVGATIFSLLTGEYVHVAENSMLLLVAAANNDPRSLAVVAPEVPRDIAAIVDRALAFEKAERWYDASTMQAALREAVHRTSSGNMRPKFVSLVDAEVDGLEQTVASDNFRDTRPSTTAKVEVHRMYSDADDGETKGNTELMPTAPRNMPSSIPPAPPAPRTIPAPALTPAQAPVPPPRRLAPVHAPAPPPPPPAPLLAPAPAPPPQASAPQMVRSVPPAGESNVVWFAIFAAGLMALIGLALLLMAVLG